MSSTSIFLLAVFLTLCAELSAGAGFPPPSPKKLGVCPRNDAICHGEQVGNRCNGDNHCPGAKKCCEGPCGKICVGPKEVKPGVCPPLYVVARTDFNDCKKDADCPKQQKCCTGDKGLECSSPEQEKPKSCPPTEIFKCPKLENYECNNDSECQKAKKCCFSKCALRCLDPR